MNIIQREIERGRAYKIVIEQKNRRTCFHNDMYIDDVENRNNKFVVIARIKNCKI